MSTADVNGVDEEVVEEEQVEPPVAAALLQIESSDSRVKGSRADERPEELESRQGPGVRSQDLVTGQRGRRWDARHGGKEAQDPLHECPRVGQASLARDRPHEGEGRHSGQECASHESVVVDQDLRSEGREVFVQLPVYAGGRRREKEKEKRAGKKGRA